MLDIVADHMSAMHLLPQMIGSPPAQATLFVNRLAHRAKRDVPVLHTGLISCSTGTSIPPKVENPGSTSVVGSRD
jgi:hypothetical protein